MNTKKAMSWFGTVGVLTICACVFFKPEERDDRLGFLPIGIVTSKVLYAKEEAWGFGPGGNETGVIVYELPDSVSEEIKRVGIDYFAKLPHERGGDGDRNGIYEHWEPTPILLDGSDSSTNLTMSHEMDNYLNRYGFGIEIDAQVKQEINKAISTSGSFAAYGRIGVIIVIPKARKIVYLYSG